MASPRLTRSVFVTQGLCILGSTGSIGQNCLRVVDGLPDRFRVVALSAGKNLDALAPQVVKHHPEVVVVGAPEYREQLRDRLKQQGYKPRSQDSGGRRRTGRGCDSPRGVNFVVSAGHGTTGLVATFEAVRAGKRVGLANKETLVAAGELVMGEAARRGIDVLPIDSEHCAVHQCLRSGQTREVRAHYPDRFGRTLPEDSAPRI